LTFLLLYDFRTSIFVVRVQGSSPVSLFFFCSFACLLCHLVSDCRRARFCLV